MRLLSLILYRVDDRSQFPEAAHLDTWHKRHVDKEKRQALKHFPERVRSMSHMRACVPMLCNPMQSLWQQTTQACFLFFPQRSCSPAWRGFRTLWVCFPEDRVIRGTMCRKGAHEFAFCEDIAVDNSASVPGPASQASQAAEVRAERAQTEWVFFRVVGARGRFNQRSFAVTVHSTARAGEFRCCTLRVSNTQPGCSKEPYSNNFRFVRNLGLHSFEV